MTTPTNGLARTSAGAIAARTPGELAGALIKSPQELADRIREMAEVAHVLTPAIAVSSIAPQYAINTAVVAIDTTLPKVDYGSAAGSDIYFQSSIHGSKTRKVGDEWETDVYEVSLNKNGLLKILGAAGVDVVRSYLTSDPREQYYWAWSTEGEITDFDGKKRRLPPGDADLDYRDGSASIGGWTPAEWAKRVAAADSKRAAARDDRDAKKIKPEPINGWSEDRVRNARRFGLRIVQAESLNRLIRNLGVKQKYTLAELQKPFVCFRCSFMPDMSDPAVRQIVTAAHMGASHLLYPQAGPAAAAPGAIQPADVIDVHTGEVVSAPATAAAPSQSAPTASTAPATTTTTPPAAVPSTAAAAPAGAQEFDDLPEPTSTPAAPPAKTFDITKATLLAVEGRSQYFFETKQGATFVTEDISAAKALNAARKAGTPLVIEGEPILINGATYLHVLEIGGGGAGAALPDLSKV